MKLIDLVEAVKPDPQRDAAFSKVKAVVNRLGYEMKTLSSKTIRILVPTTNRAERQQIRDQLAAQLGGKVIHGSGSSIGVVAVGPLKLQIKPSTRQGAGAAGISNEKQAIETLNRYINTEFGGVATIQFVGDKTLTVKDVTEVKEVGRSTTGRKKADILLVGKKEVRISIKQTVAQNWESGDTYWSDVARTVIDKLEQKGLVTIEEQEGGKYFISPSIAISLTEQEATPVIFGSDILPNGAVIVGDFSPESFITKPDKIVVKVEKIIRHMSDVTDDMFPWLLVRNDASRMSPRLGYPGIRVIVTTAGRALGKTDRTNVIVVDSSGRVLGK